MEERDAEHTPPPEISMNAEYLLANRMASKLLEIELGEKIEEPQTIYRVLPSTRAEDNGAYDPKIISIGPFHRNNEELLPMQQFKWQFLHDLIQRSSTNSLDNYIEVAKSLKSRARNCYSGEVGPEGDEFVEMLVLDGCFIIEFLVKWIQQGEDGPLYAVHWILSHLRNDLLLLENQLPFFVLQSLFDASVIPDVEIYKMGKDTLTWLSLSYFTNGEIDNLSIPYNVSHLLQLYHFTLHPTGDGKEDKSNKATCVKHVMILTRKIKHLLLYSFFWCLSFIFYCRLPPGSDMGSRAPRMLPTATKLQESGVQFKVKKKKKSRDILDVTFNDGVLEIPMLQVQATTIPLFRNLVAFEQCTPRSGSYFTSYVALMDNLINTSDDVLLLERCGILGSKLGGEKEVAKYFNSLRKGAYLEYDKHYLIELFKRVKEYTAVERHQWRAKLVHDYFGNPWSIISLIAAIVLLVLAALQTIFTVLAYFRPSHGNARV